MATPNTKRSRILRWVISGAAVLGGLLWFTGHRTISVSPRDPHGPEVGRGEPSTPPSAHATAVGFEPVDMNAKDMAWLVFGLGSSVAVAVGAMLLMLSYFHARDEAEQPRLTPEQQARIEPPAPDLQVDPQTELRQQRARENALLHGYAWIDPSHTRARIPIDRAMALTVGQSLDAGP